jgi:hypothetical protein
MIEAIEWTEHAEDGLHDWRLERFEVEEAVRLNHHRRRENFKGPGDWRIDADLAERTDTLVVIYDHDEDFDAGLARIVTVWPLVDR